MSKIFYGEMDTPGEERGEGSKRERGLPCLVLVDVWDDAPADNLAVLIPIFAILLVALFLVSDLAVDQKDGEVDRVKVRQRARQT